MKSLANRKSMQLECCHEEENHGRAALRVPPERNPRGTRRPLVAPHCTGPHLQGAHHVQRLPRRGGRNAHKLLADRLRRLEAEGVIEKGRDAADARRLVYRLTAKGLALAPVLVEMIVWGAGHYQTAAPPAMIRVMTQHRERFLADIR